MTEQWKPVVGFEGLYEVSDHGRVRSLDRVVVRYRNGVRDLVRYVGRVLTATAGDRQVNVSLSRGGRRTGRCVHSIVLGAFEGPCPEGMQATHLDGDFMNCRLSNLQWKTQQESTDRRKERGTLYTGAKLTKKDVLDIRSGYEIERASMMDLAAKYGISRNAVWEVVRRRTWTHIT